MRASIAVANAAKEGSFLMKVVGTMTMAFPSGYSLNRALCRGVTEVDPVTCHLEQFLGVLGITLETASGTSGILLAPGGAVIHAAPTESQPIQAPTRAHLRLNQRTVGLSQLALAWGALCRSRRFLSWINCQGFRFELLHGGPHRSNKSKAGSLRRGCCSSSSVLLV